MKTILITGRSSSGIPVARLFRGIEPEAAADEFRLSISGPPGALSEGTLDFVFVIDGWATVETMEGGAR